MIAKILKEQGCSHLLFTELGMKLNAVGLRNLAQRNIGQRNVAITGNTT